MAGRVVNIIPKTDFIFNIASNQKSTQPLGPRAISTPDWVSGALIVRVHSTNFAGTSPTATVTIAAYNVSITPDEPNVLFTQLGEDDTALGSVTIDVDTKTGATAGSLRTAPLGSDTLAISSMVAVGLNLDQGTDVGTVSLTISVDLVGRDQ